MDARGEDQLLRARCIGLLLHGITTTLKLLRVPSITLKAAAPTCHLILTSCHSISLHPHRALTLCPNTPYAHRSSQSRPLFLHLLLTTQTAPLQFRFRALTLTWCPPSPLHLFHLCHPRYHLPCPTRHHIPWATRHSSLLHRASTQLTCSLEVPSNLNAPARLCNTSRTPVPAPRKDFVTMMTTGTGATALEDMEAGITESLVERNGTEGAVQSAGGQTAHGIKQTMTEGVCRQDTAAGNTLYCSYSWFLLSKNDLCWDQVIISHLNIFKVASDIAFIPQKGV